MLLIDIRSTNASAAEFILYRLKLYLAGRHHHHHQLAAFDRLGGQLTRFMGGPPTLQFRVSIGRSQ